ncbi:MAG: DUF2948 family protein [Bauldia sp.]|nr:DUF2948 family protein [Bauldia sp.]MCW5718810.1 DUF2948 family protein [Bauldia sp.]
MDAAAPLKLAALDAEDLAIISAHLQDSVLKVRDLHWLPAEKRFVVEMNRFCWEAALDGGRRRGFERRRTAMNFDRVLSVKGQGIRKDTPDAVLELLAVEFLAGSEEPAGAVRLIFAGGGEIRLEVECVEARLADLGAAWQTNAMPTHDLAGQTAAPSSVRK